MAEWKGPCAIKKHMRKSYTKKFAFFISKANIPVEVCTCSLACSCGRAFEGNMLGLHAMCCAHELCCAGLSPRCGGFEPRARATARTHLLCAESNALDAGRLLTQSWSRITMLYNHAAVQSHAHARGVSRTCGHQLARIYDANLISIVCTQVMLLAAIDKKPNSTMLLPPV